GDNQGRFLAEPLDRLEQLRVQLWLEGHRLDDAGAVAHLQEMEPALAGAVVEPAFERHLLAYVVADVFDAVFLSHDSAFCQVRFWRRPAAAVAGRRRRSILAIGPPADKRDRRR